MQLLTTSYSLWFGRNRVTDMTSVRARLFSAIILAALVPIAFSTPASAVEDETSAGFETVLRGTNDYRESNGVDRLVHDPRMSAVAQAWAEQMAADYAKSGDVSTALHHNPHVTSQIPAGAQAVGENIAVNGGYSQPYDYLLKQWRTSSGHNKNMLNSRWTHIGIGTYQDSTGHTWGVQVFGDYGTPSSIPDPGDAVINIDAIAHSGTVSCVDLLKEPSGARFFRQCGTRAGNVFTFSDVPPGSYSFRLLASGGGVLYSGRATKGGVFTVNSGQATSLPGWSTTRLAGASRYDTGVAISKATFSGATDTVFVATGENFPDALAAGPVAAKLGGPVLLVQHDAVPASVMDEIRRLAPRKIVVLGGPGVVNNSVLNKLDSVAGSGGATRMYGANRYATAAKIATTYFAAGSTKTVFLATGLNYPDALSGGPVAGKLGAPLLLSGTTTVPPETLSAMRRLGVTKVVFLGGTGVLSPGLKSQIVNALGTVDVVRYSGASRYDTSAAIVTKYFDPATTTTAYVTVGNNFPDALAGTASAVADGAPILLSQKSCMPTATYNALQQLGVTKVVLLGGSGVIDSKAATTRCVG